MSHTGQDEQKDYSRKAVQSRSYFMQDIDVTSNMQQGRHVAAAMRAVATNSEATCSYLLTTIGLYKNVCNVVQDA